MKIVFTGTHSTGKTTLALALQKTFRPVTDHPFFTNDSRKITEVYPNYSPQYRSLYMLTDRIRYYRETPSFISDRSPIDALAYAQDSYDPALMFLMTNAAFLALDQLDYVFHVPIDVDIPFDTVGRDPDPELRIRIQGYIQSYLKTYESTPTSGIRPIIHTIKASKLDMRLEEVIQVIINGRSSM